MAWIFFSFYISSHLISYYWVNLVHPKSSKGRPTSFINVRQLKSFIRKSVNSFQDVPTASISDSNTVYTSKEVDDHRHLQYHHLLDNHHHQQHLDHNTMILITILIIIIIIVPTIIPIIITIIIFLLMTEHYMAETTSG